MTARGRSCVPRRHVRAGRIALVALSGAVLGACSTSPSLAPSVPSVASPFPTPVTTSVQLDTTAWYAGLIIHLDRAVAVLDEAGGFVAVDLRLENPGADVASLGGPIVLASGEEAVEPVRGTVLPDVDPGSSAGLTVQFNVDAAFSLSGATVRIGRPTEHVVVVPLVGGGEGALTLDPRALVVAGTATAGGLKVAVTGAELRADLPDWGLELPKESLALTLDLTATYVGDFAGGFAFTAANLGLLLPAGSVISTRADGHSQSVAVLEPGTPTAGLVARFEVPAPGDGPYALLVRDGARRAWIKFTIDPAAP